MSSNDIKMAQVRAGEQAVIERLQAKGLLPEEEDSVNEEQNPSGEKSEISSMRLTRHLVKTILENACAFKWSLQGLGMLRMYLSPEVRLHVWDSRYAVPSVSTMHDHPWHFRSTIIAGVIENVRYGDAQSAVAVNSPWEPFDYTRQLLLCGPGGCTKEAPEPIQLWRAEREIWTEGQMYGQDKDEIHITKAQDGTVTLVERVFDGDRDHAFVYYPAGTEWVSAEPRPATGEEVKDITGAALNRWFASPPRTNTREAGQLSFTDAAAIARGCFDYGGGYRSDDAKMKIYHHGIQTVVNALEHAERNGLADMQIAVLHSIGRDTKTNEVSSDRDVSKGGPASEPDSESSSVEPSHLVVKDEGDGSWSVQAWYPSEETADAAANLLESSVPSEYQRGVEAAAKVAESYAGCSCPTMQFGENPSDRDHKIHRIGCDEGYTALQIAAGIRVLLTEEQETEP